MESNSEDFPTQTNHKNRKFTKRFSNLQIIIEDNGSVPHSPLPVLKKNKLYSGIYSVRNFNKKRFDFPMNQMDKHLELEQTNQKLEMLKNQKNNLLSQLQELRNVAVFALIQKQQEIQKLREKMAQVTNKHHEQQSKQAEMIIQQLQKATQQIEQLKKQLEAIRYQYENQLQNKNQMIEDLNHQLEVTKTRVQELKFQDEILSNKLDTAQRENELLQNELLNSKIQNSLLQESINNSKNLAVSETGSSQKSEIVKNKFQFKLNTNENHYSDQKQQIQLQEYKERIDQLCELSNKQRQKHQTQIKQLQNYYEQKLEMTRIQLENQMKNQNSQSYSQSLNSEDFNIQVINPNQQKVQTNNHQIILKTQQDKNQIDIKSVKSNYSRRPSLPQSLIHPYRNQQTDTNINTKNFAFQKTILSNIKQKQNQQHEKAVEYENIKKKRVEKNKVVQDNGYLNYLFKKKDQIGIVVGSAIISGLIYSIIKLKK